MHRSRPLKRFPQNNPSPHKKGFWYYFRLLLGGVIGVGTVVVIGCFVFLFGFSERYWSDSSEKNIVLVPHQIDRFKGKIILAHISPKSQKVAVAVFPAEYAVKVIGGYGEFPLRSLYPLLQLEKKQPQFYTSVYSLGLGEIIDEVWWSSDAAVFEALEPDASSDEYAKRFFSHVLQQKIESSTSVADDFWLYRFYWGLRSDKVKVAEITSLEDWTKFQGTFSFSSLPRECSFAVINTTSTAGMGTAVSQVLEKSGFTVVRITDDAAPTEKTSLLVAPEVFQTCREILDHAQKILPFSVEVQSSTEVLATYRAHIVLSLGKDFAKEFTK